MSGGVDSSVAAALLVEQGYDVVGVTLRVWPWREADDPVKRFGSCCSSDSVADAQQVARALGIPHYLLNSEAEFAREVIDRFVADYRGRDDTRPVRGVQQGSKVRLAAHARAGLGRDGRRHGPLRARHARSGDGPLAPLARRATRSKDQSDFLWPLTQAQLAARAVPRRAPDQGRGPRARAPRSASSPPTSPRARRSASFPTTTTAASSAAGTASLPARADRRHEPGQRGSAPTPASPAFTIGQRKGLGLAAGRRLHVVDLDPGRTR